MFALIGDEVMIKNAIVESKLENHLPYASPFIISVPNKLHEE